MKRAVIALLLVFAVFSSVPQSSFAETGRPMDHMERCGGPMPPMHPEMGIPHGMPEMMMHAHHMWQQIMSLQLDDNQKGRIEIIKNSMLKENARRSADIRVAMIEMKELLDKDQADMKAVESKLKQISDLMTDLHLSHIRAMEEVKKVLTPQQRKKLKEMQAMEFQRGPMPHHRPITSCNCEKVEKP